MQGNFPARFSLNRLKHVPPYSKDFIAFEEFNAFGTKYLLKALQEKYIYEKINDFFKFCYYSPFEFN